MGSQVLVDLAQSAPPGLNTAIALLTNIYGKIENIKIYRQQCSHLIERCVDLMLSIRDNLSRLEEFKGVELTDEITAIVRRIDRRVNEWAALNRLYSFLRQGDIKDGIDSLHRDMNVMRFNIGLGAECKSSQEDHNTIEERDKAEIRDVLEKIVGDSEDIKTLLNIQSSRAIGDIMESLQIELHRLDLRPHQKQSFQQGLWLLHEKTSKLPPLIDCKDVSLIASRSTIPQPTNPGEWLGHRPVALRLPRSLSNHLDAQKRFQREVTLWRSLDHPNVLSLYGVIHIGEDIYTICPWMEHGNAIAYVRANPAVDRLRILSDIAAGLEYLHMNDIVHGDLRGANILISTDGSAVMADFGISKILEDCGHDSSSSLNLNPRWSAPELLCQTDNRLSPSSDVWSFAMVCLELMTGEQPFESVTRDIVVLRELDQGKLPERPGRQATAHGLKDELWSLMKQCWHIKPESRPTMTVVKNALLVIRGLTITKSAPSKRRSMFSFPRFLIPNTGAESPFPGLRLKPSPLIIIPTDEQVSGKDRQADHTYDSNLGLSQQSPLSANPVDYDASLSSAGISPSVRQFELHPSSLTIPRASSALASSSELYFSSRTLSSDDQSYPTMSFDSGIQISLDPQEITTIVQTDDRSDSVSFETLEGLVEKLVTGPKYENDLDYREVFFIGYSDFTTSEDLFQMLTRRFHQVESALSHAENNVTVQHKYGPFSSETSGRTDQIIVSVLGVMHHWLINPRLSVEPEILRHMRNFCITAAQSVNSSTAINDQAANLVDLIDSQTSFSPPSPLSPGRRMSRTSEMTPNDLAIALTLLEGDRYSAILPADYIAHLSRRTRSHSVEAAYLTNNKIVLWVKQSVLHYDTIDSRAQVFKFFVNTAVACRNFRNFASVTAIANALHSAPIDRLRLTKRELPPHLRHILDELDDLLDPSSNHKTYRAALRESSSGDRCIPWIAVHLRELYSTLQKYPTAIEVDGVPMINFERYIRFTDRVKEVLHYTAPDLERYRQQGQLAYLEHQLHKVHLTPDIDDELVKRSTTLEADETRDYRARKRELRRLGFRT
ncbi:hypothetical protein C0995_012738 [Termitomyces sp. Mi166|nr:hypothetical protein C0995_012738 [Termitomyces sp. Mi166\